jgi:DNA processing protein
LEACPDIAAAFDLGQKGLEAVGLKSDAAAAITGRRYRSMAEEILDWGRREKCHFIARREKSYPRMVEEIFDPPLLLYARGDLGVLSRPCVAIVGTRKPTVYGLQIAEGLAFDLARRDVTTVSGLARGIDAAAHRGCLGGGAPTVAVLGCGIDIVYPREHRLLSRKIEECGVLISEFPPGTSPSPQNFPVRNRIISGLAIGTLIIEAREYSGSLITARLAMEQDRDIFAVPGNVTSSQSFGPNYLIKQGAKLVQSWRDIVEEFPSDLRHRIMLKEDRMTRQMPEQEPMGEDESELLRLLKTDEAMQFDRILSGSGLPIPQLSNLLLNLEMKGLIRQVPGNLYLRVARPMKSI